MYKVQLDVEPKYITEDSKVRLYLSTVPKARRKNTRRKKKKIQIFYRILITSMVTFPIASMFINLAYLERGYWGIGGEYLLILFIFLYYFYESKYLINGKSSN